MKSPGVLVYGTLYLSVCTEGGSGDTADIFFINKKAEFGAFNLDLNHNITSILTHI